MAHLGVGIPDQHLSVIRDLGGRLKRRRRGVEREDVAVGEVSSRLVFGVDQLIEEPRAGVADAEQRELHRPSSAWWESLYDRIQVIVVVGNQRFDLLLADGILLLDRVLGVDSLILDLVDPWRLGHVCQQDSGSQRL